MFQHAKIQQGHWYPPGGKMPLLQAQSRCHRQAIDRPIARLTPSMIGNTAKYSD